MKQCQRFIKKIRAVFFPVLLFCFSCDLLRESPFEVRSWTPGDGYFPSFNETELCFVFSHEADRISVERAFTLTEDAAVVSGYFSWEGKSCRFRPAFPFKQNAEYRVTILQDAMDSRGVSLDDNFEGRFFTRPQAVRLSVLSVDPPDNGVMADPWGRLRIVFSEAVDPRSLADEITLSPAHNGSWFLDQDRSSAEFVPSEPWTNQSWYKLLLSGDFASALGLGLGGPFQSRFCAGTDAEAPFLTGAYALDALGTPVFALDEDQGMGNENTLWEGNYDLGLAFSEPVDSASLVSRIAVLGTVPGAEGGALVLLTPPGLIDYAVFRLEKKPLYGSRFLFRIENGVQDGAGNGSETDHVFRVHADGPLSMPPSFIGLRLPLKPGGPDRKMTAYGAEDFFSVLPIEAGDYAFDTGTETWIELYFATAPGAAVNLFSLMDRFRFEATNGALSFSPLSISDAGFSEALPHGPWALYTRVEVRGRLTNHPASGLVSMIIAEGLEDSFGNASENAFLLPLVK